MNLPSPLPELGRISYRRAELLRLGVTPSRLRAQDMHRVTHGVIAPGRGPHLSLFERCLHALPALHPEHFFSRRTAAELYGIPVPSSERLEVASVWPRHPPRRPEFAGHRLRGIECEVLKFRELPVASPADTWCQLASVVSFEDLVIAGDAILTKRRIIHSRSRRPALATMEDLVQATRRYQGTTGTPRRAEALQMLRSPVDSPAETVLRLQIVRNGLPEPEVNCPVPVHGRLLHADMGYRDLLIAVEYEGRYHFIGGESQARFDVERWELMHEAGWRVLRATSRDLRSPEGFLRRLRRAIAAAR